jgi:hypothetical protein
MPQKKKRKSRIDPVNLGILIFSTILIICLSVWFYGVFARFASNFLKSGYVNSFASVFTKPVYAKQDELDKEEYDLRMSYLAHKFNLNDASSTARFKEALKFSASYSSLVPASAASSADTQSPAVASSKSAKGMSTKASASSTKAAKDLARQNQILHPNANLWPAKNAVYPKFGAILPFKRIVAYYGNLYSKNMGILGQYDPDEVIRRLQAQVKEWQIADPATPVQPALHYIAVVAQGSAGKDGKYRARMPDEQIDKVLEMAKKINGIVFLDVQVALSDVQHELPPLEKYLVMPNVHLGIDPEFSMKTGKKPGTVIGTMDAADINYAASYLADLVKKNNLPPKILTFYRFTQGMVTNYQNIKTLPEVQLVLAMDGWGGQAHKISAYNSFVNPYPIQFTGFKLFYKNDFKNPGSSMMTPSEVLKLTPAPIYIQYQ